MTNLENVDCWDSTRRSRATLLCVFFVALALLFVVLSPKGWVGLVAGLFVGGVNVYLSLHPDSRFYPGRLATTQPRGPEQHPGYFIESYSSHWVVCYLERRAAVPSQQGLDSVPSSPITAYGSCAAQFPLRSLLKLRWYSR